MDNLIQNSAFKVQYGRVPDVSKLFPEIGAVVINDLDGFIYQATRYGWGRGYDANELKVNLFFDYDGSNQFTFRWSLPSTNSITIDWGDGSAPVTLPGQDTSLIITPSTYTENKQYYITISGDILEFTLFWIFNSYTVWGDVTICEKMENLTLFNIGNTFCTCDISGFQNLLSVTNYGLADAPNVYGDLSGLVPQSSLNITRNFNLTMRSVQDWSGLVNCRLVYCNLDQASIDRVIRSIKSASDTLTNLDGNALPSEAVKTDFFTALNNGVQFLFKGKLPWLDLGPDTYDGLNALRQGPNEADAVAPFVATGLGSPNVFESQGGVKNDSKFAIHADGNPNPTGSWNFQAVIPITLDDLIQIRIDAKHSGEGDFISFRLWGLNNLGVFLYNYMTEWQTWHIYAKARATDPTLYIGEANQTNTGECFIDNLTLNEIIP